jgi:hypothetical protein
MRYIIKIFFYTILLIGITTNRAYILAQSVPEASQPALDCKGSAAAYRAQGIPCDCVDGQIVCNQPSSAGSLHEHHDFNQDIKMQVVGTIFESLLTSLFSDNTANQKQALAAQQKAAALAAQQASALQREKDRESHAAYEKMMQSYKQLDGSQGLAFKTLSDSSMGFKTLDGDAETLEANARKPFDTASEKTDPLSNTVHVGGATPFFGDTMPTNDIRLLVNPENDPNVVDLRNAVSYVAKNIKSRTDSEHAKGAPVLRGPSCRELDKRLISFINQRKKFQKTIDQAQEQLDVWQTANRNALLNAAKEGLEYFTGQLFDVFAKRAEAAARLERIYEKNARQMAKEGLNVAEIQAKIKRLKALSSINRISELRGKLGEIDAWRNFLKDGVSALINQLTASNQEIQEMLADPRMQQYFETEAPELKTLLDISTIAASYNVLGKWVAKKLPIIGAVQFAINQTYNATDWFLSYRRIIEANKINGRVMDTARGIQENIDDTYLSLRGCS